LPSGFFSSGFFSSGFFSSGFFSGSFFFAFSESFSHFSRAFYSFSTYSSTLAKASRIIFLLRGSARNSTFR